MTSTSMVHVRVDHELKQKAGEALAAMGLSISDAVRVLLQRVVAEQRMPFSIRVPNATTLAAMDEAEAIMRTQRHRFASGSELLDDLEKNSTR
ncbi:MAG: type II toxin-antitoxin system RelB/DinJ family antitoxin [Magnetococcales bacterium]|nr:type II toxin-antitoxin system RelB/DinJ family antitoxin [Magnetococcales bacterium]